MDRPLIHDLAQMMGSKVDDRRGNVVIQCPMAPVTHASGTDRNPAMSVKIDPDKQSVVLCFACGIKGTLLRVMEEANEATSGLYENEVAFVKEHDKGGLAGALAALKAGRRRKLDPRLGAPFDLSMYVAKCSRYIPNYLIERGVARPDIERWRIGYDPEMRRAVFPVWDEQGILVGAARRTVLPREVEPIKYYDTPGLPKDRVFYGEHMVDPTREHVYLVEGILDAVFASRVLPNVIALMGVNTGIGAERLRKLRRWCRSLTLVLDSDKAGDEAWAGKDLPNGKHIPGLRERLRRHVAVKIAHLPSGEDPASVPAATLVSTVQSAVYLSA